MCSNLSNVNIPSLTVDGSASGYVIGNVDGYINSARFKGSVDGVGNYKGVINGYVNGTVNGRVKGYTSINGAKYGLVDQDVKNATISSFSLLT